MSAAASSIRRNSAECQRVSVYPILIPARDPRDEFQNTLEGHFTQNTNKPLPPKKNYNHRRELFTQ